MNESELILAAVWRWFPPRRWAVCENVYWGFGLLYEADAIAVSKSARVHELEAKSAASDLKRDARKHKWQRLPQVDYIWYIVPEPLADLALELGKPLGLGVLVVSEPKDDLVIGECRRLAMPKLRRGQDQRQDVVRDRRNVIWRLAALRYWDERVHRLQKSAGKVLV